MRRHSCRPRQDWQRKVEEQGLLFHTPHGIPYWDESAYYTFTMREINILEAAVAELQRLCLEAGQHIIDHQRFAEFGFSKSTADAITAAWNNEPPAIYGRMDLAYDGIQSPKLLEYNADTPTALLEAAVVQWYWLQENPNIANDQWNSIHERLVAKWKELRDYMEPTLYFAHTDTREHEDLMTATYLRDTASEAGFGTVGISVNQLGWDKIKRCFVDLEEREIKSLFKLYPWEWLVDERFGEQVFEALGKGAQFVEPIWKLMWSNKGLLPILWELFPNHPLLLPAYFDEPRELQHRTYVKKPVFSREGANIAIMHDSSVIEKTDGNYADNARWVYQAMAPIPERYGKYPVIGAWVIDQQPAGMGIRESDTLITNNLSRFVPHVIEG